MQDSIRVSAGLALAWGLSSVTWAEAPLIKVKAKPVPAAARVAVDSAGVRITRQPGKPFTVVAKKPLKVARKIVVRGQNEFEEFEEAEPTVVAPIDVIPPAAPTELIEGQLDERQMEALRRLKDRSVKERWEKIHQEWLENKKKREAQSTPATPDGPAATESGDPAEAGNPFDSGAQAPMATEEDRSVPEDGSDLPGEQTNPDTALTPAVPASDGATRPGVPADKLFLQSQQKQQPEKLPTEEDLTQMLNDDNGMRLPPPVRDPNAMPKITEIIPNPKERPSSSARPIPEQDEKNYVKLDREHVPYVARAFPEFTYTFQAANVWAHPLYFEDPHLERYGHTRHPIVQPFYSTGLFAMQVVGLPYQMAINPLSEKVYPLGWYLPGDNVPYRIRQIPLSAKGAAVEAGLILGTKFATP